MSELIPDNSAEVGSVKISVILTDDGLSTVYTVDGLAREAALGHMLLVMDRMRQAAAASWEPPFCECPHCGEDINDDTDEDDDDGI